MDGIRDRIKILSAFIRECEDMLQTAKGLPDMEQSILKRLNTCKRNLDILLAEKISGTVKEEAKKLDDKIDDLLERASEETQETRKLVEAEHKITRSKILKPVICAEYRTNWQVVINKQQRRVIIKTYCEDEPDHPYVLPRTMFELFVAISQIDRPIEQKGWITWREIVKATTVWKNAETNSNHVIKEIKRLKRNYLEEGVRKIIRSRQNFGYRLETHPENIIEKFF